MVPFKVDHAGVLSLSGPMAVKWSKLGITEEILCTISVTKFHRSSPAKGVPRFVILTETNIYFLDPKSLVKKEVFPVASIRGSTFSPFNDGSFVVHFQEGPKGDVLLSAAPVEMMAMVSRIVLLAQTKKYKVPAMVCSDSCEMKVQEKTLKVRFREDSTVQGPTVDPGAEIIVRVP